jgi:3-hydroxyisobutyrate dehydrogenase
VNGEGIPRVAILGLGIMGSALARDAVRAGLKTSGWDRTYEKAAPLASDGMRITRTAPEAAADADVVVTMVADAAAVMSVMRDGGAFAAMKPGAAWAQMATIGVAGVERCMRLAETRPEVAFFDAPVIGSKVPAEEGKLVVLASGDRVRASDALERFFGAIASTVHWLGDAGQGMRMKLIFNTWIGFANQGLAEVATLADALGVDRKRFAEIANGSPIVPPWVIGKLNRIVKGTFDAEFPLRWAEKDLRLALEGAGPDRSRLPILADIDRLWADAAKEFGDEDLSAIYLALRRKPVTVG